MCALHLSGPPHHPVTELIACGPKLLPKSFIVLVAPLIMPMVLCAGCEYLPAAGSDPARRAAQGAAAASAPGLRGIQVIVRFIALKRSPVCAVCRV